MGDRHYAWRKLKTAANNNTESLGANQETFKKSLVRIVRMFVVVVAQFRPRGQRPGRAWPAAARRQRNACVISTPVRRA